MTKPHGSAAICSYCRTVYRLGALPFTHGICRRCLPAVLEEIKQFKNEEDKKYDD